MKYYLKNMSYLYIMTSINKSEMFNTKENLEQLNYGTAELNALFNSLPEDTQNKIKKYDNHMHSSCQLSMDYRPMQWPG
jgi:hypothetical protein